MYIGALLFYNYLIKNKMCNKCATFFVGILSMVCSCHRIELKSFRFFFLLYIGFALKKMTYCVVYYGFLGLLMLQSNFSLQNDLFYISAYLNGLAISYELSFGVGYQTNGFLIHSC